MAAEGGCGEGMEDEAKTTIGEGSEEKSQKNKNWKEKRPKT